MNTKMMVVLIVSCAAAFSTCATGGASSVAGEAVHEEKPSHAPTEEVQEITTSYAELWSSDSITVKAGVPVRWYVEAAPGSLPAKGMACGKTIKIPGLGWGSDSYNDKEGHLTMVEGKNLVYEFTPQAAGDILFTCWMGSECHYNYIHVTADGAHVSDASQARETGEAHTTALRRQLHGVNKPQS